MPTHYGALSDPDHGETVCAVCGIDALGLRIFHPSPTDRFKSKNAAFPRESWKRKFGRLSEDILAF